jgi:hypothetical protein
MCRRQGIDAALIGPRTFTSRRSQILYEKSNAAGPTPQNVQAPGRELENWFTGYEAFALLTGLRLMRDGWQQGLVEVYSTSIINEPIDEAELPARERAEQRWCKILNGNFENSPEKLSDN